MNKEEIQLISHFIRPVEYMESTGNFRTNNRWNNDNLNSVFVDNTNVDHDYEFC